jgi:succinyl-diaminopimelate desuccinylase
MTARSEVSADAALGEPFLVEVLSSLVRIPSVNPEVYEVAMADRVRAWVADLPVTVEVVEFERGRPSVAVVLAGEGHGPRLVLNGHMDTVPIDDLEGWTDDPFKPTVRDGYLYGRGACDMKAGLATQIAVLHHFAALGQRPRGTLVVHFAAGEECAEPGTLSLLRAGFGGDFGIVTEPTELQVAVAERGLCHYRIAIHGRAIHAGRADLGVNPVLALPAVLEIVREYDRDVRAQQHELLGGGTCTPTVLRAGVKENAVADLCELLLDRRLVPGESADGELKVLQERLAGVAQRTPGLEVTVSRFGLAFEPAETPADTPFINELQEAVEEVTGRRSEVVGTPFASDVRNLVNDGGINAVTFGPGSVAECHCIDERVAISQLRDAAHVLAGVARRMLL